MSTPFQNRIVGTIIVAAAIIIFLPNLLDGKKQSYQADFDAIPETPKFQGKTVNNNFPQHKVKPKPVAAIVEEVAQDQTTLSAESSKQNIVKQQHSTTKDISVSPAKRMKPIAEKSTKATKDNATASVKNKVDKYLPEKAVKEQAWVIHLGSFKHKKNVAELLAKLKKEGYTAYTKPIKTKQGVLTKVFIGPELIKSSLVKKLPNLKKLTNIQGKVARFYPTKQ